MPRKLHELAHARAGDKGDTLTLCLFAYRIEARTGIGTLGWNYPLGARDSIDFSWRHVNTTPKEKPAFDYTGPLRYIDNQYFITYLMRF